MAYSLDLSGRVALVTGASGGLGEQFAKTLAKAGAAVVLASRRTERLMSLRAHIEAEGGAAHAVALDVTDLASIKAAVAHAETEVGPIDILINNAGGSLHTPYRFLDEDETHWKRVMDLNVMGAVRACRAVLPSMAAGQYGRIINFGSKAGRFSSLIAGPNYTAAKGAVSALTRQLAQEFGPQGITVNCICPGVVMTERTRGLWAERRSAEERERILQEIPLRRYAEVEDVAAAVAFFASSDASFITGVTLDLNGGQGMA